MGQLNKLIATSDDPNFKLIEADEVLTRAVMAGDSCILLYAEEWARLKSEADTYDAVLEFRNTKARRNRGRN